MAEKILNTRILNKIDTLENWNTSTLGLKKGEIALATVAATAGTGLSEPVVMIKVGEDGVKTFKDLPWNVYAKASDVIAAAKSEDALTAYINNVIAGAGIATDSALQALTTRVSNTESDISALQGLVGDSSVANQIVAAIGQAKTDLVGSDNDAGTVSTIKGAKKHADDLNTAMDARVKDIETAIGEGGSVAAQITTEINKLDSVDEAVSGKYVSAVSETNGIITVTRESLPDYTDTYAAKKHTHEIADVTGLQADLDSKAAASDVAELSGKVTTLIGDDANKSVRKIANEELAAQLIPEGAKESLDTLQEIATWIQKHPDDASAMNTAITALEGKVGDESVSAQIASAISALKDGDIKTAVDRIAALEKTSHTHVNKELLDTYTQTEVDLSDAVAKKHSHANADELAKFATGDKAKLDTAVQSVTAGTGLKASKTGTDVTVDFDDTITFVFDCGDSTTV